MADQRGRLALLVERRQQAAQRRAVQQILHRRVTARDIDGVVTVVAALLHAREAEDRRFVYRSQLQLVEQRQVLPHAGLVIAEIHLVDRMAIDGRRLAERGGESDRVAGVQQLFDWLHQFIDIKAGLKRAVVAQRQLRLVRQDDQHIGSVGDDSGQSQDRAGDGVA
ncbi:conserved hypothetical protein [Ricinus communis]|uniref:Uncharacterized protein n=1 Tax=Ricinus communis TaxID=3988 RepID=B9TPX6_RICCO|nr:conserved hypothetical protein [Ricinus communis]